MPTTHNKRRKSKSPSRVAGKIAVVIMGNINTPTKKSRNDADDDLSFTNSKSDDDGESCKTKQQQQQHHHHHAVVDRNKDECDICGERGGERGDNFCVVSVLIHILFSNHMLNSYYLLWHTYSFILYLPYIMHA